MSPQPSPLWATTPFTLIPTPFGSRDLRPGKAHGSQFIAQQMTHLHNCILRILNAIYNQAPHVTSATDIKDFLALVKHWHDELEHHHMTEEECFFPKIEAVVGVKGIMEGNVEQHHLFEPGLEALGKFATQTKVEEYDGEKLQEIIDSFGEILTTHLTEEIDTLVSLEIYNDEALRKVWDETHKYVLATCDNYVQLPMLSRGADATYEDGKSGSICDAFPWFLFYLIEYWFSRKHKGAWRFLPCTTRGKPLLLAALPKENIAASEKRLPSTAQKA